MMNKVRSIVGKFKYDNKHRLFDFDCDFKKFSTVQKTSIENNIGNPNQITRVLSKRSLKAVKPRIVIIGSGWGGYSFLNAVDKKKYDVQVISPSNHFLFTPLLPSSVVGTLEFRAIQEPVRTVKGLKAFYQAKATSVDFEKRFVICQDIFDQEEFKVEYDYLICTPGAKTNTFGTPGIDESNPEIFFLKHLYHARQIRNRILECFERAAIHSTNNEERDRLLTIVVVGGGPTNCELVGELHDFISKDVAKWFPDLVKYISIHLVERAPGLLGSYDPSIGKIVEKRFKKRNIKMHLDVAVEEFDNKTKETILSNGTKIPTGLMVWSAGLQQVKFIENAPDEIKGPGRRIIIDDYLQVFPESTDDRVFAFGDCAVNLERPMAPIAQAAAQQARYLAKAFNEAPDGIGLSKPAKELKNSMEGKPFQYFSLGSMVTFGNFQGALDFTQIGRQNKPRNFGFMHGVLSYFVWRSAYFSYQNSWTNRMLIPMYWFKSFVLGRDISRF